MGIFFSLLYFATAYLTPMMLFGNLGEYHIEEIVAFLAIVSSVVHISGSGIARMPQFYGILGMFFCVACSMAFNGLWMGVPSSQLSLLIAAIAFFFVLWNFRTEGQIKLLIATLMIVALVIVYLGASAVFSANQDSPYVFMMGNGTTEKFYRIRGLGIINDPNDLCQLLVGLIPCAFILWRTGNFLFNFFVVLLPVSALLYGMFLTHSRGGMLGLLVGLIVLGRRKFGILPAIITGGVSFVALSAIGWTGGRDISAESGADRMEAWSVGLSLIRAHPLFGVGYMRFAEYFHITAHNTVVVCAAEIGVLGFFCWTLLVVPTMHDLIVAARPAVAGGRAPAEGNAREERRPGSRWAKTAMATLPIVQLPVVRNPLLRMAFAIPAAKSGNVAVMSAVPVVSAGGAYTTPGIKTSASSDDEIRRMCGLMTVSLSGFFASGWFLSRSYTMVLFINIGLALAVYRLAVERGIVPAHLPLSKAAKYSGVATVALVSVVYVMLRITNLLPK